MVIKVVGPYVALRNDFMKYNQLYTGATLTQGTYHVQQGGKIED